MGGLTSGLFQPSTPKAALPQDLQGLRGNNIQLLQYLLFGQNPMGTPTNAAGAFAQAHGLGNQPMLGMTGDPTQRLENFFGKLAPAGIQQFLSQPSPEQRAMDLSLPALQEILTPGTSNPMLERDLSLANQQGGRFGSANEILRGQALGNLFGLRTQAANTLGVLGSQAGQGQARQAGFMDLETQRRLGILMNLLGVSQQASFNVPTTQAPSPFSQLLGLGGLAAGLGWNPLARKPNPSNPT